MALAHRRRSREVWWVLGANFLVGEPSPRRGESGRGRELMANFLCYAWLLSLASPIPSAHSEPHVPPPSHGSRPSPSIDHDLKEVFVLHYFGNDYGVMGLFRQGSRNLSTRMGNRWIYLIIIVTNNKKSIAALTYRFQLIYLASQRKQNISECVPKEKLAHFPATWTHCNV